MVKDGNSWPDSRCVTWDFDARSCPFERIIQDGPRASEMALVDQCARERKSEIEGPIEQLVATVRLHSTIEHL